MVVLSRELQTSLMGGSLMGGPDPSGGGRRGVGGRRGSTDGGVGGRTTEEIDELTVDLVPYMNTSTFIVRMTGVMSSTGVMFHRCSCSR